MHTHGCNNLKNIASFTYYPVKGIPILYTLLSNEVVTAIRVPPKIYGFCKTTYIDLKCVSNSKIQVKEVITTVDVKDYKVECCNDQKTLFIWGVLEQTVYYQKLGCSLLEAYTCRMPLEYTLPVEAVNIDDVSIKSFVLDYHDCYSSYLYTDIDFQILVSE